MGAVSIGRYFNPVLNPISGSELINRPDAAVSIGRNQDEVSDILKTALDAIGGISRFVKSGQVVAIKPNATWAFPPNTASSTDPSLLRALIELVKDAGAAKIIVMDHCSIEPGTVQCLNANGLGSVVRETGVEGNFPDRYLADQKTYTTIDLPQGKAFSKIGVIKDAVNADVRINMGLAKSHSVTRMTLTLKHMMGFLEKPASLHTNIHKGIADINTSSAIKADLHILEALRVRMAYGDFVTCGGPQTDETHPFMIKRMNQIIVGTDPVLMDAYACSTFYDVRPKEFAHLQNAADWGIGDLEIDAAIASGKFLVLQVGSKSISPKDTAESITVSDKAENIDSEPNIPVAKPIPTITGAEPGGNPLPNQSGMNSEIINPNELLKAALIPASIILTGAGLVASRKKNSLDNASDSQTDDETA